MARFTEGEERWIVQQYREGRSLRTISVEMQSSDPMVKDVLARHGIALRPPKRGPRPLTDHQQREIRRRYHAGEATTVIAREMGLKYHRVAAFLDDAGMARRAQNERRFDQQTRSNIARRYGAGESPTAIASAYGCSVWTVREIARRCGVEINPKGNRYREFSGEQVAEMVRLWQEGVAQAAIGQRFGASQVMVSRVLRRAGFRATRRVGQRSNFWKGGRIKIQGYWAVLVPPDHPFASMRNRLGYVLEHRLVMAERLGRPLGSREQVHHIDGDRENNAPENLQLRQGAHGKGVAFCCADCGSRNIVPCPIPPDAPAEPA